MKIDGYEGICAACFSPIQKGEGMKIRENGRNFHITCTSIYPDNYYVKLEKRLAGKGTRKKRAVGGTERKPDREKGFSIEDKAYVPLNIAMEALLYSKKEDIEKCVNAGMPTLTHKGSLYFCLEDCHKWFAGQL